MSAQPDHPFAGQFILMHPQHLSAPQIRPSEIRVPSRNSRLILLPLSLRLNIPFPMPHSLIRVFRIFRGSLIPVRDHLRPSATAPFHPIRGSRSPLSVQHNASVQHNTPFLSCTHPPAGLFSKIRLYTRRVPCLGGTANLAFSWPSARTRRPGDHILSATFNFIFQNHPLQNPYTRLLRANSRNSRLSSQSQFSKDHEWHFCQVCSFPSHQCSSVCIRG